MLFFQLHWLHSLSLSFLPAEHKVRLFFLNNEIPLLLYLGIWNVCVCPFLYPADLPLWVAHRHHQRAQQAAQRCRQSQTGSKLMQWDINGQRNPKTMTRIWDLISAMMCFSSATCPQRSLSKCSVWPWKSLTGWLCGREMNWKNRRDCFNNIQTCVEYCHRAGDGLTVGGDG